jgi:hypothetical protein
MKTALQRNFKTGASGWCFNAAKPMRAAFFQGPSEAVLSID